MFSRKLAFEPILWICWQNSVRGYQTSPQVKNPKNPGFDRFIDCFRDFMSSRLESNSYPRRPIRTDPSFIRRIDYPFMKNILKFTESENLHGFFSAISALALRSERSSNGKRYDKEIQLNRYLLIRKLVLFVCSFRRPVRFIVWDLTPRISITAHVF